MEKRTVVVSSFAGFDRGFRIESPDPSLSAQLDDLLGDLHLEHDQPGPLATLSITEDTQTTWNIQVDGKPFRDGIERSRAIDWLVWALNRFIIRAAARDRLILHAGAIATPSGSTALALCGASGRGKSTLTLELVRRGYPYLTDEALHIQADGLTRGLTKPLTIKVGSFPLFADLAAAADDGGMVRGSKQWHLRASAIGSTVQEARLGALVFPRHQPGADLQLRPVGPAARVSRTALSSFSSGNGRIRLDQVRALADALADIDAVEMVFDDLHEAAETLEGLLQR